MLVGELTVVVGAIGVDGGVVVVGVVGVHGGVVVDVVHVGVLGGSLMPWCSS